MDLPVSTYRVQLNRDFQFKDAEALLPYLSALGITHLYASPIFQARAGSTHGYDVTNPSCINPELGTPQEFDSLIAHLKELNMGLLLDIVPNHMAASPENPWWMDVLENGSASSYSAYFDIEWGHRTPTVQQKIILPILGEPYAQALEQQKLQLSLEQGGFRLNYYSTKLPIDPCSYYAVLSQNVSEFLDNTDPSSASLDDFRHVLERAERLPSRTSTEWDVIEARRLDVPELKHMLWDLYSRYQLIREFIDAAIRVFNGEKNNPRSFDLLDALLETQAYRLTYWRVAREKINYRRFFDISDLVGLRAQDPQVFEGTHQFTLQLLAEKKVDALRIDHIDGLYDPLAYLARLQVRASAEAHRPVYVVVEKIISGPEALAPDWPVAGTTGYDFLGVTNNLFIDPKGLQELDASYKRNTGFEDSFEETSYKQRRRMLQELFAGEIGGMRFQLGLLAETDRYARDLSPSELGRALLETTSCLPVYRTYIRDWQVSATDRDYIQTAIACAKKRNPQIDTSCFDFLCRVLLLERPGHDDDLRFVMRWQQLTGPVMAKGVEDTTLYQYNRLISMNDVGGSPVPESVACYHSFLIGRQKLWPETMNASSTHDTKRSEDVRARLNLLSEMPRDWDKYVRRWMRWNVSRKTSINGNIAPDANDEYMLYQTMLGAWPLDSSEEAAFCDRLKTYMRKAVREAKRHSSWFDSNTEYENAVDEFIDRILDGSGDNRFLASFRKVHTRIAFYGAVNSLAQTLLKICSPGIPDFYQGTTLWDFSLVDPDNRRPPEIPPRLRLVDEMQEWNPSDLLQSWTDGRVKSFLILKALQFRNADSLLFRQGEYIPLDVTARGDHIVAFARRLQTRWALVVIPRFVMGFSALEKWPIGRRIWGDAALILPPEAPSTWTNAITGERVENNLGIASILKTFPVALLYNS